MKRFLPFMVAAILMQNQAHAQFTLPHDAFSGAIEWTDSTRMRSSGLFATLEAGEPSGVSASLWWKVVAADDGRIRVELDATTFPASRAEIFTGTELGNLQLLATGGGPGSRTEVFVARGETYFVRLGSVGEVDVYSTQFGITNSFVSMPVSPLRPFSTGPSGGSGGLSPGTHTVTLAGQPAIIVVGTNYNPAKPTYLGYYLHGDNGGYQGGISPSSPLKQLIDRIGMVYVAPQAPQAEVTPSLPGGYFPWGGGTRNSKQKNASQIRAVIDHMFSHYNVHRDRVLGAGASGGSFFHDDTFLPQNGNSYPSFFLMTCGASGIDESRTSHEFALNVSQNPTAVAHSEMSYVIGIQDFLYDEALVSASTYTNLGFSVYEKHLPGVGHCDFNVSQEIANYWTSKINEFEKAASLFPVAITKSPDQNLIRLSWPSSTIFRYTVESSVNLRETSWETCAEKTGSPHETAFVIPMDFHEPQRFYRVRRAPVGE